MTQRVILSMVRHGQSAWNLEGRLTGSTDIELTDLGRAQARKLGEHLVDRRFDSIVSSDLKRAVETARLAYGEPVRDPRLRELHFGELEGAIWQELEPRWFDALRAFGDLTMPGGESMATFSARVHEALDGFGPGEHLVVAHGGVLRVALRAVGPDRFLSNCALVRVDWTERRLLSIHEEG